MLCGVFFVAMQLEEAVGSRSCKSCKKEKIEKLYKQVELWKKAEEIRAFASSFTKNAIKNRKKLKSVREIRKYVEFVKEYANSIDPLSDYFKDIP